MRFGYYKMINDMAVTLKDALGHVKKTGDNSMLGVCIQSLQAIIKAIVPCSEDIKNPSVIETLNSMIALLSSHQPDIDKAVSLAEKLISDCRTGLNYKIKVLFVAELGGKWDSMESVYEECMKRDDIEVDVVLQPVFREVRLPDGSVRHEEANYDWLTPMGIKHIPYKQYDMKKICPDITFFSQPYDGCTDPMFWPENMSKYTRVVYLPYYSPAFLGQTSPAIESFFYLPSQQYSWRIACQSDIMKKYYRMYASRKGENVVVTGIPKWDRPMRINKENTPCPDGWKEKIKGRKVFLWNTHFDSYSKYGEPFCFEKQILDMFTKREKEAALIWRPHPMTETVIKTYNPEMLSMYFQLIKEIEDSPNIIIDKYSSYSYSFVWSDALISGGRSSIVLQYILMDKPTITLMNCNEDDFYIRDYTNDKLLEAKIRNVTNNIFSVDEIEENVDAILNGFDPTKELRAELTRGFYKYADGRVGKRLTERLIEDILEENGLKHQDDTHVYKHTFLLIGTEEDSKACIDKLEEQNADHCICTDILSGRITTKNHESISLTHEIKDNFEYFIITSKEKEIMITEIITSLYGVPKERIISFWKMFSALSDRMICDKAVNLAHDKYDGIILGSSKSYYGLLEEKLNGNWCDLSVPYQDIYYMKRSLERCLNNATDRFRNLKYAVIDLQDTFFFNYDVSVSEYFLDYIKKGGFALDPHNYSKNRYFKSIFDDVVTAADNERYLGISDDMIKIWKEYFEGIDAEPIYEKNIYNELKMITNEDIATHNNIPEHALVMSEKVIKENLKCLCELFDMLLKASPNIKFYITMIPGYMKTEQDRLDVIGQHLLYLRDIKAQFEKMYGAKYLDLSSVSNVSVERCCYRTPECLNRLGAEIITYALKEMIEE